MAVPKKRTGHSAQGKRRSNWKASKPELTTCPNCGAKVLTHTVCTACGTYKGKIVSKKSAGFAEEVTEEKKELKQTKEAVKEETPVVESKAEEVVEAEKESVEATEETVEEAKDETPEE